MNEKKPIYKKWWFWVIVIIIVFAIGGNSGSKKSNETTPTDGAVAEQQQEEVIQVDYKVLHKDYMDNPIAADEKYKGKLLQVTGNVDTIDREISQETYITFKIAFLEDVRLTFKSSEESKVAQLKKGQTVTVKGRCKGTLLSSTVALGDCELIN